MRNKPALRFVVLFLAAMVGVYALYKTVLLRDGSWCRSSLYEPYLEATARLAAAAARLLGLTARAEGATIYLQSASIRVRSGCDGIEPFLVLVAGIVSYPAPLRSKVVGLLLGGTVLLVVNQVRIVSLLLINPLSQRAFMALHMDIWPVVLLVLSVGVWWIWARFQELPPVGGADDAAA